MQDSLEIMKHKAFQFRDERDWRQFHDPKNLAEAISIESGELLERFLWVSSEDSKNPDEKGLKGIQEEVADIMIFLLYMCDSLNIDVLQAVSEKIALNARKYPVERSRGSSEKSKG
jgi:dCTP diphosphatase